MALGVAIVCSTATVILGPVAPTKLVIAHPLYGNFLPELSVSGNCLVGPVARRHVTEGRVGILRRSRNGEEGDGQVPEQINAW